MSRGVNKVIIVGNLGNDPETRFMPSGGSVTNISVATSEQWKDKQSGQPQERTEWHRIVLFNRLAEIAAEYLRKGSKVYIEGQLRTRKWQDQSGQDKWTTEIVAREMQMLDSRQGGQPTNDGQHQYSQPTQQQAPQGQAPNYAPPQNQAPQNQAPQNQAPPAPDYDDDIPF